MRVTKKHEIDQNSKPPQINHGKCEQHHRHATTSTNHSIISNYVVYERIG